MTQVQTFNFFVNKLIFSSLKPKAYQLAWFKNQLDD